MAMRNYLNGLAANAAGPPALPEKFTTPNLNNFNNRLGVAAVNIPSNLKNNQLFRGYMNSFKNKNPDLVTHPDLFLARMSGAAIPALTVLATLAVKKGEAFVRSLFRSKTDQQLMKKFGITTANGDIINNLRRLAHNTRASNNRAIVGYGAANSAVNNYKGNNLNEIKRRANNLNAHKTRVYSGIIRTILLVLLSIKLAFGIILQETKELANISTFNKRTIKNDINTLARVLYVLMNVVVPVIYALVQRPAVKMLAGGRQGAEFAVGMVSVAVTKFGFDNAAIELMTGMLGDLSRQADAMIKSPQLKGVFNAVKLAAPGAQNVVVNAGTSLLRITRGSILSLINWLTAATTAGIFASATETAQNAGLIKNFIPGSKSSKNRYTPKRITSGSFGTGNNGNGGYGTNGYGNNRYSPRRLTSGPFGTGNNGNGGYGTNGYTKRELNAARGLMNLYYSGSNPRYNR